MCLGFLAPPISFGHCREDGRSTVARATGHHVSPDALATCSSSRRRRGSKEPTNPNMALFQERGNLMRSCSSENRPTKFRRAGARWTPPCSCRFRQKSAGTESESGRGNFASIFRCSVVVAGLGGLPLRVGLKRILWHLPFY